MSQTISPSTTRSRAHPPSVNSSPPQTSRLLLREIIDNQENLSPVNGLKLAPASTFHVSRAAPINAPCLTLQLMHASCSGGKTQNVALIEAIVTYLIPTWKMWLHATKGFTRRSRRRLALRAKRLRQTVADQPERRTRDEHRETGIGHHPPVTQKEIARLGDHQPPFRIGRLLPKSQE